MKGIKNTKAFEFVKNLFHQPILCALLAFAGWYVFEYIVTYGLLFSTLFLGVFPDWVVTAAPIPLMTLYLLLLKKMIGNGFTIGFRFDNLGKALLLCASVGIVIFCFGVQSTKAFLLFPMELSGSEFTNALLEQIFGGMNPGILEEYSLRVVLMGIIMHLSAGKKHQLALAVGLSSIIFGATHLVNLSHADLTETIYQVFYAFAVGILFAAVYARTRNILAPMIAHSLWDIVENFHVGFYPSFTEMPQELQPIIPNETLYVIITILFAVVGLYLLRPSRHHEIEAHWGSLAAEEVSVG